MHDSFTTCIIYLIVLSRSIHMYLDHMSFQLCWMLTSKWVKQKNWQVGDISVVPLDLCRSPYILLSMRKLIFFFLTRNSAIMASTWLCIGEFSRDQNQFEAVYHRILCFLLKCTSAVVVFVAYSCHVYIVWVSLPLCHMLKAYMHKTQYLDKLKGKSRVMPLHVV